MGTLSTSQIQKYLVANQGLAYTGLLDTGTRILGKVSRLALQGGGDRPIAENRRLDADQNRDFGLLTRIVHREQEAFGEFYDLYSSRVFGLVLKILNNHSDAEEVLQETFWQVWKSADKYNQARSSPRVWLFLMARSRAIDHLRRRPKSSEEYSTPLECSCEAESPKIESQESSAQVRNALAKLPEEQAASIQMAFYQGLTHVQIAERLEVPLGTVKTRIRSGMHKLRTILQGVSA